MKSRLGYLIELFQLTGRELASVGHVDVSLISKWKNGSRTLKSDVESAQLISQYIYAIDKKREPSHLNTIMTKEYLNYMDYSEDKKLSLFKEWLCQSATSDDFVNFTQSVHQISLYESSMGLEYRRMQILKALEHDQNVFIKDVAIFLFNDYDWLDNDSGFNNRLVEHLEYLLQANVCVTLYFVLSYREEKFEKLILNLTKLMLYTHFQFSTKIMIAPIISGQSYLINMNERLVHGISNGNNYFTEITLDIDSNQMHFNNLVSHFNKKDIKSTILSVDKMNALIKQVLKTGRRRDNSYFISQSLFFTSMKEDLLLEILNDNLIDDDKITKCLNFYKQLNKNFKQNVENFENRHIYYYEVLETLAMKDSFICSNLSAIVGDAITIRKDQYIQHLQHTIYRLKTHENYHIAIVSENLIASFLHGINIWIKDSNMMLLWAEANVDKAAYVVDFDILDIYTQYFNEIWSKVSFNDHITNISIMQLNKLIKIASVAT